MVHPELNDGTDQKNGVLDFLSFCHEQLRHRPGKLENNLEKSLVSCKFMNYGPQRLANFREIDSFDATGVAPKFPISDISVVCIQFSFWSILEELLLDYSRNSSLLIVFNSSRLTKRELYEALHVLNSGRRPPNQIQSRLA
jgi:hypothetical protein